MLRLLFLFRVVWMSSSCVIIGFIRGDLIGFVVSMFVVLGFSEAVACNGL